MTKLLPHIRNPLLRRLLALNKPLPNRTPAEVEADRQDKLRWNFTVNVIDGAHFWFSNGFMNIATIVPLFVAMVSDGPWAVGIVALMSQGGWFLPQLFTANWVEGLPRKRAVMVNIGFFAERIPHLLLVFAAVAAAYDTRLALVLFLVGWSWRSLGAGVVATAWQEMISRVIPARLRGRQFGLTTFLGTAVAALAGGLSAWLLAVFPFPYGFVFIFLIGALANLMSWFWQSLTREPEQPLRQQSQPVRQFWRSLPQLVRDDGNFRRFLVARGLLAFAPMGNAFVILAAKAAFDIPNSVAGGFTVAVLVGQVLGTMLFGLLADRLGHKLSLEVGAIATVAQYLLALLAPTADWYYLVFGLQGFSFASLLVSGILVTFEFAPTGRRPTYVGLTNTINGVFSMVAPLVGAALVLAGYPTLFVANVGVTVLAWAALHFGVQDPRFMSRNRAPAQHEQ